MTQSLADHVAAQMRAEMARQDVSASALARELGENESWVRRRMRGRYAITMADLERIAGVLRVPLSYFMPAPERVA